MSETKLRELLSELADAVPGPTPEIPRHVVVGTRRRRAVRIGSAALALAVVGGGLFAGARSLRAAHEPRPVAPPGSTGTIAFTRTEGGIDHVYVMRADGSGLRRVTAGSAILWAPGGDKVIVARPTPDERYEYALVGADGPGERALPATPVGWSPDGSRILVSGALGVVSVPVDAGGVDWKKETAITRLQGTTGWEWSPDGSHIAYRVGDQLTLVNADGTGTRLIATGVEGKGVVPPKWSPDSSKIVFVREEIQRSTPDHLVLETAVANADGSGITTLSSLPGSADAFAWSPDGSTLVFSQIIKTDAGWRLDLYSVSADGSRLKQLIHHAAFNPGPPSGFDYLRWSRDGTTIGFAVTENGKVAIYGMRADGSGLTLLSSISDAASVGPLMWLPDDTLSSS